MQEPRSRCHAAALMSADLFHFPACMCAQVVAPYAKAVIDAAYPSDQSVAEDAQVQAFAAALVSPHGSNLVRINDANELKTKAQLTKFVEDYITIVLTHGTAHLQVRWLQQRCCKAGQHVPIKHSRQHLCTSQCGDG